MLTITLTILPVVYYADEQTPSKRIAIGRIVSDIYSHCFETSQDPPRYIYKGQQELEKRLSGTEAEKRKYAALLPLRLYTEGTIYHWPNNQGPLDSEYLNNVLRTIIRQKWTDTIPLLEYCIEDIESSGTIRERIAGAWFFLKKQDMTEEELVQFIVDIITGKVELPKRMARDLAGLLSWQNRQFPGSVSKRLKDKITTAMMENDLKLKTTDDIWRSVSAGSIVSDPLSGEENLKDIMTNATYFNCYALIVGMYNLSHWTEDLEELYNEAIEKLWYAEDEIPKEVLHDIRYDIASDRNLLPKNRYADKVLLKFLKSLNESPDPFAGKSLTWNVMSAIMRIQYNRPLSSELIKYLQETAEDPRYKKWLIEITPESEEDEIREKVNNIFRTYISASNRLKNILKTYQNRQKKETR